LSQVSSDNQLGRTNTPASILFSFEPGVFGQPARPGEHPSQYLLL
jgi:hypothetical protein